MITKWIKEIVNGVGGLRDYHTYEMCGSEPTLEEAIAFALRCLANPDCEGSQNVLDAIIQKRIGRIAEKQT
jgi:hypothetical protein